MPETFRIFSQEPYRSHIELIAPRVLVLLENSPPFPCSKGTLRRAPRETKGLDYRMTTEVPDCGAESGKNGSCC